MDDDLTRDELHRMVDGDMVWDVCTQIWTKGQSEIWYQKMPSRYLYTEPVSTAILWELYGPIHRIKKK